MPHDKMSVSGSIMRMIGIHRFQIEGHLDDPTVAELDQLLELAEATAKRWLLEAADRDGAISLKQIYEAEALRQAMAGRDQT